MEITYQTAAEYVRAYIDGKVSYAEAHKALVREGRTTIGANDILNWAQRLDNWKRRNRSDREGPVAG